MEELARQLGRLGVRRGEALMVHASLRRIGPTQGRASGVLAAIERAVGPEGTLLMVVGAVIEHEWVNQHPENDLGH